MAFIFGGNTGETPESLKRKRSIAEALAVKTSSAPRNVGEGLNALGNALIYRALMGKVDAGEAAGKKELEADRAAFMGGFGSSPAPAPVGGSSSIVPMTGAAGEVSATSPKLAAAGSGNVYDDFIGGVKAAGLTNPYGLAAVAATGQAESGWSPQNANRSWSDPSQSGQAGTAGGVMSWRNERLNNLYSFARQRGEQPGSISPATQAAFFVQEDPSLIQALNGAKSAEEAQRLMNNAWKFAGYDKPGGETARRMGLASSYLPRFQGGETELASLDPSAGMSASQAIDAAAAPSGYVDPMVSAPNSPGAVANALMSAPPQSAQASPPGELSSTTNAARQPYQGVTVAQALGSGPSVQQAFKLLNNPYATDADKAMATSVIEQAQKRNDPSYQLEQDYKRAQLEALRAKPEKQWQRLDDGTLFRPETGETKVVGGAQGAGNGQFRFKGNAVDAQALNGLMEAGKLTPEQAQQMAAGKTVTGPNGEIIFMTPEGVFAGPTPPQPPAAPQAPANGVDIFGGDAPAAPTPPAPPAPPQAPQQPQDAPQRQGMIPLTQPKVTVDESKAGGFADRMLEANDLLDTYGNAGLSPWSQAVTDNSYIPDVMENYLVNENFQKYSQARRNFINAQLRRESGAVISPEEFENANKQYFPMPGDTPEVLKQKAQGRKTAVDAMIRDAGPTFKRKATGDGVPSAGQVVDGYRFKGGDPSQQSNWEKVQ
ncbi:hypothetical protein GH789_12500 [Rhizobium pusense]|uniref:hypothetical protein n=1 Tax=Agrobacterium pusense TaxID=648995 RepID=UPI00129C0947|nr:hypothetical protein [Agrobacterium pusense]MRG66097.1 hypothetical protein [Agrobacterium pusense]